VRYRVEQLALAADVSVATVRYYQGQGLLEAPVREGRVAWYDDDHLNRLHEIRDLADRGFTLAQIRALGSRDTDRLLAELATAHGLDPTLDRSELSARTGVSEFVIDLVVGAGLLEPSPHPDGERFAESAVDMLVAARTLLSEGVQLEELTALAMRHATHVEDLVDDTIELFRRHHDRTGRDRSELAATLDRLAPIATGLVAQHFERTLVRRALQRLADDSDTDAAGSIVVMARAIDVGGSPALAAFVSADDRHRSLWLRPDAEIRIAALGAVETLQAAGDERFSGVSAARAALSARVLRRGPAEAPAPILIGGFAFSPGFDARPPAWGGFGDSRFVLPEITVIDGVDGTWLLIAGRVGSDGDITATEHELTARADLFHESIDWAWERADLPVPAGTGDPPGEDDRYLELVAEGISAITAGELDKVVLARRYELSGPVDVVAAMDRLQGSYPTCAVFAFSDGDLTFFGATPEELVTLEGSSLHTTALAGTAPRDPDPEEDTRLARELLDSAKNRAEHEFVVSAITDKLSDLGLVDPTPAEPDILSLARVHHLRTPITARVERRRPGPTDMDVLRVAGVLHPTPAVGGTPDAAARRFIVDRERFDRGWYAAPIGWCDLDGNGEMRVALRSALWDGERVHLFAGAGIVAASDPTDELAETTIKLMALLDVIGP
jgi:isochorismate synthase